MAYVARPAPGTGRSLAGPRTAVAPLKMKAPHPPSPAAGRAAAPLRGSVAAAADIKWAEPDASAASGERVTASALHPLGIYINSNFDAGNIEVVNVGSRLERGVVHEIDLKIAPDPFCERDGRAHFQWFYFRVSGAKNERLRLRIVNAGDASFGPGGFGGGYAAASTYDRHNWMRVQGDVGTTDYDADSGVLTIDHTPRCDAVYFAYWPPFTLERHQKMVARVQATEGVALEMLGETLDGHDQDLLRIGPLEDGRPRIWILARQHPGEPQGEYFCEGLLARLLDPADAVGRALREAATFFVVPNMNPDGSWRGHLRTNAAGVNLNRAWAEPVDRENAPEVAMVKQAMRETGVDLCLDVHGDEAIPGVFAAGCEGVPGFVGGRLEALQNEFIGALKRRCPEFTTEMGYGKTPAGKANPAICKNAVAMEFNALAMTLELPFKDAAYAPDPKTGWSPSRSHHLGRDVLGAIYELLPSLKAGK